VPRGEIGVDAAGDVFTLSGSTSVTEFINRNGSYTATTILQIDNGGGQGDVSYGGGLAVATNGDVYVSEGPHYGGVINHYRALSPGKYAYVDSTDLSSLNALAAVDRQGKLFYSDQYGTGLRAYLNGSGPIQDVTYVDAFAVDASDEVFFSDPSTGFARATPDSLHGGFSGYPVSPDHFSLLTGGATGVVYTPGNEGVLKLQTRGVNFGSFQVGASSAGQQLVFSFTKTVTLASGDGINSASSSRFVTDGQQYNDFQDAGMPGTNLCSAGKTYSAGDTCTLYAKFAPSTPGARKGAVILTDNSGQDVATAFVYGTGIGPQATYLGQNQPQTFDSFMQPVGVAISGVPLGGSQYFVGDDSSFEGDPSSSGWIHKVDYGDFSLPEDFPIVTGLGASVALSLDGAGDLLYVNPTNHALMRGITGVVDSSQPLLQSRVGSDGSGIIYAVDASANLVKLSPNTDGTYTRTNIASGVTFSDIAVHTYGDIYVLQAGGKMMKYGVQTDGDYRQSTVGISVSSAAGLAVDGLENLWVTDGANGTLLKEVLYSNGGYKSFTAAIGLDHPSSVAVDSFNQVLVAETARNNVQLYNFNAPPELFFNTPVQVGTVSNYTRGLTLLSSGNAPLLLTPPSTGTNPSLQGDFRLGSGTCPVLSALSNAASIQPGDFCMYQVHFAPTTTQHAVPTDPLYGGLEITDNAANLPSARYDPAGVQTGSLQGLPIGRNVMSYLYSPKNSFAFTSGIGGSLALQVLGNNNALPTGTVTYTITFTGTATAPAQTSVTQTTPVTGNRQALVHVPGSLAPGFYDLTASYSGDANFTPSTLEHIIFLAIKKAQ
jgi:hypothetical protein